MPPEDPKDPQATKESSDAIRENTEAIEQNNEALIDNESASEKAKIAQQKFANLAQDSVQYFKNLNSVVTNLSSKVTNLSSAQTLAISQAQAFVTDSTKIFANLGKADLSTGFTEQYSSIKTQILDTFNSIKNLAPEEVSNKFRSLGLNIPIDIIKKGVDGMDKYLTKQLQSADAALRLRDAILSNAAATGKLDQIYKNSGESLNLINNLLGEHANLIAKAAEATNTLPTEVQKYYNELSKIPGMLDTIVSLSSDGAKKTTMLAASIDFARGSGQEYTTVLNKMREAVDNYGVTGEKALAYVSRMSEASNKAGLELSHVQNYTSGVSDTLGKFGNNTDAATNILLKYSEALKATGASSKQTTEILSGLTKSIASMDMAKKALLSARSGGPGGIMGALQIEDLLRKGRVDKIMEMVMKDLTKQFGKVVTMDEAVKDPRLAAQFQKQRMMLTKGPYGQLFNSEAEAIKGLDMFKQVQEGKANMKELFMPDGAATSAGEYIKKGQVLTDQTRTAFGMQGIKRDNALSQFTIPNLGFIQNSLAASSGSDMVVNDEDALKLKQNLSLDKSASEKAGVDRLEGLVRMGQVGKYEDTGDRTRLEDLRNEYDFFKTNIKSVLKAPFGVMKTSYIDDQSATPAKNNEALQQQIKFSQREQLPQPRQMAQQALPKREVEEGSKTATKIKPEDQKIQHDVKVEVTGFCLSCKEKIDGGASIARSISAVAAK